jgi:hypothetical protein
MCAIGRFVSVDKGKMAVAIVGVCKTERKEGTSLPWCLEEKGK